MKFTQCSRYIWESTCGDYSISKLPAKNGFEYKAFHGAGFRQIGDTFTNSADAINECKKHSEAK